MLSTLLSGAFMVMWHNLIFDWTVKTLLSSRALINSAKQTFYIFGQCYLKTRLTLHFKSFYFCLYMAVPG